MFQYLANLFYLFLSILHSHLSKQLTSVQNHHLRKIFDECLLSIDIYNSRDFQNIPHIFRLNRSRDELNNFNVISLDKVNKDE